MIQILNLHNIQYTQLNPMTWCATAEVTAPFSQNRVDLLSNSPVPSARETAYHQRMQQRAGVRLLLQSLLDKLNIIDSLDDTSFPYRLVDSQYYVCFSHTGASNKPANHKHKNEKAFEGLDNKVAVVISPYCPAGIDIELNNVKWQVVQRFYHANEIVILQTLPTVQRDIIAKLLWQIKESFIKIYQYKLAQGLGIDYSYLIADLIRGVTSNSPLLVFSDNKSNYYITLSLYQQTVIVH